MRKWPTATLQELADIRISNVDKKSFHGEMPVRLCNYMDAYGNDAIHAGIAFMEATATPAEISRFKVDKGDVLITKDSETPFDIGIPAVVVDDIDNLVCGYHLALLKPNRDLVDPVFLCKQLGTPAVATYFSRHAAGSTRYGLSNRAVANTQIPLPSLVQQRKVAAVLTSIDTAIEKTEALIEKFQKIKAGLMHDLFTRGVLPNGQLRPPREQAPELYRQTAIGWIPQQWAIETCAEAFSIDSGITLGPHRRPLKRPHPYLRVGNVFRDRIVIDDLAYLEATPSEVEAGRLKKFDLLVVEGHANRNEIGRCAMVADDGEGMLFQNHLFRLRAIDLDPRYALLWLNSHHAQRYWECNCATSSGLNTINRRLLGRMPVCGPTQDEQRRIVSSVFSYRERIAVEKRGLEKLRRQKIGLMQDLLTGKVPFKVVSESVESVGG